MAEQKLGKIPLRFPTGEAKKDLEKAESLFKKTAKTFKDIEGVTFKRSILGMGGLAGGLSSFAFQSTSQSKSSAALQGIGQSARLTATATGSLFGASGAIVGQEIGRQMEAFVHALGEEIRAVKDKSLNEIQGIAAMYAEVGASMSKEMVKTLLSEREAVNKRIYDAQRQVKNVQSSQANILQTIGGAAKRKMSDAMSHFGFGP